MDGELISSVDYPGVFLELKHHVVISVFQKYHEFNSNFQVPGIIEIALWSVFEKDISTNQLAESVMLLLIIMTKF